MQNISREESSSIQKPSEWTESLLSKYFKTNHETILHSDQSREMLKMKQLRIYLQDVHFKPSHFSDEVHRSSALFCIYYRIIDQLLKYLILTNNCIRWYGQPARATLQIRKTSLIDQLKLACDIQDDTEPLTSRCAAIIGQEREVIRTSATQTLFRFFRLSMKLFQLLISQAF